MFVNSLDTITIKFIKAISLVFKAINLLHDCDEKYLLQIRVRLKKTIIFLNKINTFITNTNKFIRIINA